EQFRPMSGDDRRIRPAFVCSRAFDVVYDNATIVRAVGELRRAPATFAFTFLSNGPLLRETIALADRELDSVTRSRVSFAGGVALDALTEALRSASVYISASRSDGASSSLLE